MNMQELYNDAQLSVTIQKLAQRTIDYAAAIASPNTTLDSVYAILGMEAPRAAAKTTSATDTCIINLAEYGLESIKVAAASFAVAAAKKDKTAADNATRNIRGYYWALQRVKRAGAREAYNLRTKATNACEKVQAAFQLADDLDFELPEIGLIEAGDIWRPGEELDGFLDMVTDLDPLLMLLQPFAGRSGVEPIVKYHREVDGQLIDVNLDSWEDVEQYFRDMEVERAKHKPAPTPTPTPTPAPTSTPMRSDRDRRLDRMLDAFENMLDEREAIAKQMADR